VKGAILAAGLLAASCHGAASCECGGGAGAGAQRQAEPVPIDAPGGCRNADVPAGSTCRFNDVFPQHCADCAAGEELYRVAHYYDGPGGTTWGFGSAMVRIPAGKRAELEAFLRKRSPVGCNGWIVNPPCNPDATSVELDLQWPDWVKR
jgi:hypothetical protein